ncbi:hypothetical protein PLESTB_000996500 [Pleodorina starrii]|uniref:Uncharacterized protein n=1 Tax=Pleodorina starrii TaxID=330485 RepID=A0A9W6BPQ7_9CHLO|nr:hypothetical protein PLESTM_001855500 [Pleodorina starrii]GLC55522.1 hypothetical protein PLESTB_000996500 [Pleodorina starrii]GLC76403.1 hypothetical protein PLESTF_001776700 [Pleodorina starrii]
MKPDGKTRRVALVTGCDSAEGIGQALCRELVTRGFLVFATGLSLEAMAPLHDFALEQIRTMVLDVTSEPQVEHVIGQVVAEAGGVDVLINNAGIAALAPSIETDLAVARRVHEVNFWGTWATCKAAGRRMADRRRGVIVNIGSMASRGHPPFTAAYNTSKAAAESLTHALRLELAPYGVAVVYVAPTWCRTAITANASLAGEEEWQAGRYGAIREDVVREASGVYLPCAWPPARIARQIVDAALRNRPPMVVYGGGQHRILGFLAAWMPRWVPDWVIWHKSGLARLARLVAADPAGAAGDANGGAAATASR